MKKYVRCLALIAAVVILSAACAPTGGTEPATASPATVAPTAAALPATAAAPSAAAASTAAAASASASPVPALAPTDAQREPVTVTYWYGMHVSDQTEDFEDAPGFNRLAEMTGVTIDWQLVPAAGISEAYNLMMASGDIPDIVSHNAASIKQYYQAYEPLDPYISGNPRYANLDKHILGDEYLRAFLPNDDGMIRVMPNLSNRRIGDILIVREDLVEKYGITELKTLDDWHNAFLAAKADGIVPYLTRQRRAGLFSRLFTGYMDCVQETYFIEDGVVKYGVLDDRFKATVEIARQWYAEGLIDLEYPTTDATRWWEEVLRGNVFATHDNIVRIDSGIKEFVDQGVPYRLMGVAPMQSHYTGLQNTVIHYPHVLPQSVGISAAGEHIERILDMFDYCFSDDGYLLMNYGIEGMSYEMVDEEPVADPDYDKKAAEGLVKLMGTTKIMVKNQRDELYTDFNMDRPEHNAVRAARDLYADNPYIRENWVASLSFTDEENAARVPLNAEMDTYRDEWLDKFIMGAEPMERWDEFVDGLKRMRLDEAMVIYQAAADRLLK